MISILMVLFAGDLGVFHEFHCNAEYESVMIILRSWRDVVHVCGVLNREEFTSLREQVILFYPQQGRGEDWVLLG